MFVNKRTLKSKAFTAQPTETSVAVAYAPRYKSLHKQLTKKKKIKYEDHPDYILNEFTKANGFKHSDMIERSELVSDFHTEALSSSGVPSLGFIGISYLRRHFPDHLIVLVDFTFEGEPGHKWSNEKEYALRLEKEGHLIRLLDKVCKTN